MGSLSILLHQYGLPRTVLSLIGGELQKQALITGEEWTALIFRHYITKQPKEDISSQLHDLSTNKMLKPTFSNLRTLTNVCMSLPVGTASVENGNDKNSTQKQII